MTRFIASKFDPENDTDRPIIGSVIDHGGSRYLIRKVGHVLLKDIDNEIDVKDCDTYLLKEHSTRMEVCWIVWVNAYEETNES